MPVLTRRLLFVSFLLVILGGCTKTQTQPATSASDATVKKTELRQQASDGSKPNSADRDSTDPGPNAADPAHGDLKMADFKASLPGRPPWPQTMGEFRATSRDRIPVFPRALSGYVSEKDKDFTGKPYPLRGNILVADGNDWKGLRHFPTTRNGCSFGVFMLRWRVSDPSIRVYSTIDNPRKSTANVATGTYGYMYGTICDKPRFKFANSTKPNWPNRADVFYELKFWEAKP
jgi:hypothetical protein